MGIIIRREKENEYRAVENLTRESFWNVYRPGCMDRAFLFPFYFSLISPVSYRNETLPVFPSGSPVKLV